MNSVDQVLGQRRPFRKGSITISNHGPRNPRVARREKQSSHIYIFHEQIARNLPGLKVHAIRGWPDILPFESGRRFLREKLGVPRDELLSANNTIVLIENAQSASNLSR